jgi:hypothetical protein
MNAHPVSHPRDAVIEEVSKWAVGLGILAVALAPLAIPIVVLTAVALIPLLIPVAALAILAAPALVVRAVVRSARKRRRAEPPNRATGERAPRAVPRAGSFPVRARP